MRRPPNKSVLSPSVLATIFVTLNVGLASGLQCYWCGPLAEQVHRSRRAPPCVGAGRHITFCEPGYTHCAIVASAPPYVKSRFCVKASQNECYPVYCSTTETWKMTCPCQGDLCNGAIGEREKEAFLYLTRLVNKNHSRIRKRAPNLKKKYSAIVNSNNDQAFVDNYLGASDNPTELKSDIPPINRSATFVNVTTYYTTPSAFSVFDEPKQNSPTAFDSSTARIEIDFSNNNSAQSIHKIKSYVLHEIEIQSNPTIQEYTSITRKPYIDTPFHKNGKLDSAAGSTKLESNTYDLSTLQTEVALSSYPINASPTNEISVTTANEGTTTRIAPPISAQPFTTLTTLTSYDTTASNMEQTLNKSDLKPTPVDPPTAEAFLQQESKPHGDEKKTPNTASKGTTEFSTIITTYAPNSTQPTKKRQEKKTKNAAVNIHANLLSILHGIILIKIL